MAYLLRGVTWKTLGASAFFLALLFICGLYAATASAATYYVNNQSGSNCNDSGSGTSSSQPWCTFTPVNNKGTYAAGDQILLARGATWNQQMTVTGSGN